MAQKDVGNKVPIYKLKKTEKLYIYNVYSDSLISISYNFDLLKEFKKFNF